MKRKFLKIALLTITIALMLSFTVIGASALEPGDHTAHTDGTYCLVCDLVEKIEALPDAGDISIDNAASVIQQINDIDRIKYDLTDAQFEELAAIVGVVEEGTYKGYPIRYYEAITAIRNLNSGNKLLISKFITLANGEILADTSEAEIKFELVNLDTDEITVLTMFDLGSSVSSLGADYYSMNADGWSFAYDLPVGRYTIKEINTDSPVTVNGRLIYMQCVGTSVADESFLGNGATFEITADSVTNVSFYNSAPEIQYVVLDKNGDPISDVTIGSSLLDDSGFPDGKTTGDDGIISFFSGYTMTGYISVIDAPVGYCIPDVMNYTINTGYPSGLTDEGGNEFPNLTFDYVNSVFTLTLYKHSGTVIPTKAATCTTDGILAHYQCDGCDKYFSDENVEVEYSTLILSSHGHYYGELSLAVSATCEQDGISAHYKCSACSLYFDAEKNAVEYNDLIISRLGHNYGELRQGSLPTCTRNGKLSYYKCSTCLKYFDQDKKEIEKSSINLIAVGHDYGDLIAEVPAACETEGTLAHYCCSRCQALFDTDKKETDSASLIIPAALHNYGEWVITVPAGEATAGERTKTCHNCGSIIVEEIRPIGNLTYAAVVIIIVLFILLVAVFLSRFSRKNR